MAAATTPLTRRKYIERTFAAAFEALKEHAKAAPDEAAEVASFVAAHVRAAWPQAVAEVAVPAPSDHASMVERVVADGGRYTLTGHGDGMVTLDLTDLDGDRAVMTLVPAEVETLRADLARMGGR